MSKPFASSTDLADKPARLDEIAEGVYAFTADGDPNVGAVVGADGVLCVDARATPGLARQWLDELRRHTDKPIRYLVLTHYHAVRVLGAEAFGAQWTIAHEKTLEWIIERGAQDWASEQARMPRLFRDAETIPGLTRPNVTFSDRLSVDLGGRLVELCHLGRGHTQGDTVVWLPQERVLFAGDLVEVQAALYTGDAFHRDWMTGTLDRVAALDARSLVGGRGPVVEGPAVAEAIARTREFLTLLHESVQPVFGRGGTRLEAFQLAYGALKPEFGEWPIFEHCLPFNVARLWDELAGLPPRIWTAERDQEIWAELQ